MARTHANTDNKHVKVETSQAEPTAPRLVDVEGRALDAWGLPLSGPARARALVEAGKPDPRDEPDAWPSSSATPTDGVPPTDPDKQD